jgi:hypothetical protein
MFVCGTVRYGEISAIQCSMWVNVSSGRVIREFLPLILRLMVINPMIREKLPDY